MGLLVNASGSLARRDIVCDISSESATKHAFAAK